MNWMRIMIKDVTPGSGSLKTALIFALVLALLVVVTTIFAVACIVLSYLTGIDETWVHIGAIAFLLIVMWVCSAVERARDGE